jgi:signal transduction histidine kinase
MEETGGVESSGEVAAAGRPRRASLSLKLLILTIGFVILAEVFIYVPSIANFERFDVEGHLQAAAVAARSLMNYPADVALPQTVQADILGEIDAYAVAVRTDGMKRLVAMTETAPPTVTRDIDLRNFGYHRMVSSAFDTLLFGSNRTVRVVGPFAGGEIEVVYSEAGQRNRLVAYSSRVLLTSIAISTLTAIFIYLTIRQVFLYPMKRLGIALYTWSHDPENVRLNIRPSGKDDEIGRAEMAMLSVQQRLQELLKQQRRLVELGLAVSKINHDLRNLLASAQLVTDRLSMIPDPAVQRFAPKLVGAIDRAISYCQSVLAYGKAQELPPARRLIVLNQLTADVAEMAGLGAPNSPIEWVNAVPDDLEIDADAEQLSRVLLNLARNAIQALEQASDPAVVKRLTISAMRDGAAVRIIVADTGPGLPEKARQSLFKPFQGSVRRGGTGLGLAIAAELVSAHGGIIRALDNGPGAVFEIEIPDRVVEGTREVA